MSEEQIEDFLEVDVPIPGQNYACVSFVSPEKELKKKETYFIHEFLKSISSTYDLSLDKITEKYDDYLYNDASRLEKEFDEINDFKTSVRGVKIRGCYDTYREAQVKAKVLQRKDPSFHVYVGQIGYWLPWDPNTDEIEDQQYTEGQLNKLVKKYKENETKRDTFFEEKKKASLDNMTKENTKNKKMADAGINTTNETTNETAADTEVDQVATNDSSINPETTQATHIEPNGSKELPDVNALANTLSNEDPWMKNKNKEIKVIDLDV